MVFRLPTPFDAIAAPPPSIGRNTRARPWRGSFILHGINLFQSPDGQQRLLVASAETEGNNRADLWPKQFNVHTVQPACSLSDVQAWATRNEIPLCMFMPDRHAAGGGAFGNISSATNDAHFRALSRVLSDNQLLCIASWPTHGSPGMRAGAGILIFPSAVSRGLLIGAVFIDTPFPEIIGLLPGGPGTSNTNVIPSGLPSLPAGPYASSDFSFTSSYASLTDPGVFGGSASGQGHVQGQGQYFRDDPPSQCVPSHGFTLTNPANSSYAKPHSDGFNNFNTSDGALRAALSTAPFDWSMFDDTDGSGSTSPGSTRTW